MTWFSNLKLNAKFNLILSSLLVVLFLVTIFLTYRNQQALARDLALEEGRAVARQLLETFDHMSEIVRDEPENNYALVPQVVATQIAKRISTDNQYSIRQVSLRYRNPDNRPNTFETEKLKLFENHPETEIYQVTKNGDSRVFHYMQATMAEESCLKCHGTYESAPSFIQQHFPPEHPSYNYQVGQVIGAVSFTKPMAALYQDVASSLRLELFYRVGIIVLVLAATAFLIRRILIAPIKLTSETIHRVTRTGNLEERIPGAGSKDEIGRLMNDFNEMMGALGRTTLQRQESEDRYRSLIEAAQSAIVTFLENGKIVISNQQAETLLGLSRNKLLGECFFDFLEEGETLQQTIAAFSLDNKMLRKKETSCYRLRVSDGTVKEMEMTVLLASKTDHSPMFTAILRTIDK